MACAVGLCLAAGMLLAGCSTGLPDVRQDRLGQQMRDIPRGAAPIHSWYGSRADLHTYWGLQEVSVSATAYLPEDWKNPGDGYWRVEAQNAEGKNIPFIGVIRKYVNENGNEVSVLVPELDLNRAPDGLYLTILPNVELRDSRVVCLRPDAVLCEIRHHTFKPFRVRIPLIPENESPLTPIPEPLPEIPAGTPI